MGSLPVTDTAGRAAAEESTTQRSVGPPVSTDAATNASPSVSNVPPTYRPVDLVDDETYPIILVPVNSDDDDLAWGPD